MKDYGLLQKRYLVQTYPNRGLVFAEGDGVYLKDIHGARYLDAMTNYGVNVFGYGHPEITAALARQVGRLTTLHGSFANDERAEAAQALVARCGGGLAQVYFANSGAEANEAALKFAALATGRKKFIACRGELPRQNAGRPLGDGRGKIQEAVRAAHLGFPVRPVRRPRRAPGSAGRRGRRPHRRADPRAKAASASPRRASSGRRRASAGKPERSSSSTRSRREPAGPAGSSARRPRG